MNKYILEFNVGLRKDLGGGYSASDVVAYESMKVEGLTFFQVCFILGGLQVLANETKEGTE